MLGKYNSVVSKEEEEEEEEEKKTRPGCFIPIFPTGQVHFE